jgi:hypothetical protein
LPICKPIVTKSLKIYKQMVHKFTHHLNI